MTTRAIEVLIIIEAEIATTHLIEQILRACEPYGVYYRKRLLAELKTSDIKSHTIPLFIRSCAPSIEPWINALITANHPYIYYIDDNFWRIVGDSPLAQYYQHPNIRRSLNLIASNATSIITNSIELAEFVTPTNPNVTVLSAFFDFTYVENLEIQLTREFRIGFAGSTSRKEDLEIIKPLISPILKAYPHVIFEFAGALPNGVLPNERIRFFAYQDSYEQFIRFQASRNWRIGLAPLIDKESNRCKTNNKYREYGACGIAGIYSDIPPYSDSVDHEETGFLVANTTSKWMEILDKLISKPELVARVGANAAQDTRNRYCAKNVAMQWSDFFISTDQTLQQADVGTLKLNSGKLARLRTTWGWIRLQILMAYRQGGLGLVTTKSFKRISQILRNL